MAAESDGERVGNESEPVEVYLADIGRQRAVQPLPLHQGVDAYRARHQLVAAVDGGLGPAVLHLRLQVHMVQVPTAVA